MGFVHCQISSLILEYSQKAMKSASRVWIEESQRI